MARNPRNEAFLRTSFLSGANAAYVEDMQAEYERNPGSVSDEWRHFFESLNEERSGSGKRTKRLSPKTPLSTSVQPPISTGRWRADSPTPECTSQR